MTCGVPQGSVLGPLLWNLGYDWVIRGVQLPRMITVCYADDTLVAVRGKELDELLRRAAVATELTVQRIKLLGLRVALPKTEAMVLGRTRGWGQLPEGTSVRVGAVCLLASTPPWELEAEVLAERYRLRAEARGRDELPDAEEAERTSRAAAERLRQRWRVTLEDSHYGTRTIEAILPVMDRWVDRRKGALTYRVTQIVSGHGCFGHYLHKIQREPRPQCHECGVADDTAQHTLEECTRWAVERATLRAETGAADLSLRGVVETMLGSERKWKAVASFCEAVMSRKEEAEREREAAVDAPPLRRKRLGRRRRAYARLEP
ncbi:uncharacterized protein LOC125232320 [Leguminivora glycinivorella]|uniref:uncharacterized protein LOC125232320 n=1 Tax=Leguminivora glycinivorella TaxID=1035111 RepID=UPI00200C50EB|nr:uncharacterized protein LOC125232320 [Leguminivora glycinivorella]